MARISWATGKGHDRRLVTRRETPIKGKYTKAEFLALLAGNFIFYPPSLVDNPYKSFLREQPLDLDWNPVEDFSEILSEEQQEFVRNWIPEYLQLFSVYDEKTEKEVSVQDVLDRMRISAAS